MANEDAVRVEGLARLRRDIRRLEPESLVEVRLVLKGAAGIVANASRPLTAHRTGRLSESFRPGTSGNTAFVRSPLPYAAVQEFGGTISPRGVPITITPHPAVTRALADNADAIVESVGAGIERVARQLGWQ